MLFTRPPWLDNLCTSILSFFMPPRRISSIVRPCALLLLALFLCAVFTPSALFIEIPHHIVHMHEKEHISHAHMDKLVCGRSAAPKPDNSLPALRTMPSHAEFLT